MRKLVVAEYVSLDGVIQAPGHAGEDDAGGFLLGRLTYEIFAASWPKVTDEHDQIVRALNTLPKYVASKSLPQADWQGTTVLDGDVPAAVADLKRQPGRPLVVVGSGQLAQTLREADLVDEYRLWLHPVVLGGGKRLFRDGGPPASFRLADSTTTSGGLVLLTYDRP
ncbi:MAG: dihydrofolate reductase family protein [Actinomycetes bacterium]